MPQSADPTMPADPPSFTRFAIYDPGPAPLADFGARWLGWDTRAGQACAPLAPPAWTEAACRYGFHATIKPPFRLAEGALVSDLTAALRDLAARLSPVHLQGGLVLTDLDGFLALTPRSQPPALTDLAASVVRDLDPFRAPLTEAEIARRRPETLSQTARANLDRWGYPHVMEDFRYHMTLTGPLDGSDAAAARAALTPHLAKLLPDPHPIIELALMAEDQDGFFHDLTRCRLGG